MAASRDEQPLHVLFLPYFATGHLIPLVNAATLFASRGVRVTILTTPSNASLFRHSVENNPMITTQTLRFPSTEVGLPEGIESFSTTTSPEMSGKVFYAIFLLQKPMEDKIRELRPHAIFSDMFFPWTVELAEELKIPRLMFNQSSYMYNSILQNLLLYKPHEQLLQDDESQTFLVPGLPDKIEFKLSQLTYDLRTPADKRDAYHHLLDQIRDSEDRSYGIVHDTFYELEPAYAEYYQSLKKSKCFHIGPISHFSSKIRGKDLISDGNDGIKADIVEWLNEQKPKSVLYISFGTTAIFPDSLLNEIAQALEASGVPFIWVLLKHQETTWMPDGFQERAVESKRGFIVRGWAPQLVILDHPATGGFMTHCGWNSILEAIAAAVPLVTWPLFAEQFYNEKLVEVLGLGAKVGSEIWNYGTAVAIPELGCEKIKKAIERVMMNGSEESQHIREKASAMSKMAKNAIEEGGSSWNNLTALIHHINSFTFT